VAIGGGKKASKCSHIGGVCVNPSQEASAVSASVTLWTACEWLYRMGIHSPVSGLTDFWHVVQSPA
jgi:hypothetical protein